MERVFIDEEKRGIALEKTKEKKEEVGLARKHLSEALKGFYQETLEPKFDRIDQRFERVDGENGEEIGKNRGEAGH